MEVARQSILKFCCIFNRMKIFFLYAFIFTSCFLTGQELLATDQPATNFDSSKIGEWRKMDQTKKINTETDSDSLKRSEWRKADQSAKNKTVSHFDSLKRNEWKKIGGNDTIVSEYQLDSIQRKEWKKFNDHMNVWMNKTFLKKYKISISCAGWTGVYLDFIFAVDESGAAAMRKINGGRICANEFSDNQRKELFLELSKHKFPVFFRKKICYYRFGRVLKC